MNNHTTDELLAMLDQPTDVGTNGQRIENERRLAAMALGTRHEPDVVPALLERLRSETPGCGLHETLTWSTVQHIDTALPGVLGMLTDADPHLRRTGAHILSKVGAPEHLEHLIPLVGDADADVAMKAYRAVANSAADRPEVALDALAGRLGDGDQLQRDALTTAFHRFGERAVDALVGALADPDPGVREHAADALGHLGEDAAAAAEALAALAGDEVGSVRLSAVAALGQLGEPATGALSTLADGADPVVAGVARRFLP